MSFIKHGLDLNLINQSDVEACPNLIAHIDEFSLVTEGTLMVGVNQTHVVHNIAGKVTRYNPYSGWLNGQPTTFEKEGSKQALKKLGLNKSQIKAIREAGCLHGRDNGWGSSGERILSCYHNYWKEAKAS